MTETLIVSKDRLIEVYAEIDRAKTLLAASGLIFSGHTEPTEEVEALATVLSVVDNVLGTTLEKVDACWAPS